MIRATIFVLLSLVYVCYGQESTLTVADIMKNLTDASRVQPFRICGMSTGTNLVRLNSPRDCNIYSDDKIYTEGIMVVFKENIVPYIFNVSLYTKEVTTVRTYNSISTKYLTDQTSRKYAPQVEELQDIDERHECSTRAYMALAEGSILQAFHKDEDKKMLPLEKGRLTTETTQIYQTVKEIYINYAYVGYKTCTTVNCLAVQTQAKSAYPYNFFVLATGEVVEMSPFYDPNASVKEEMNEDPTKFFVMSDYSRQSFETNETLTSNRNFLEKSDFIVSWDMGVKEKQTCTMKLWQTLEGVIRSKHQSSLHFTAKSITSTFSTEDKQFDSAKLANAGCVKTEGEAAIDALYKNNYAKTHTKNGSIETYFATGGFIIMFQPLVSKDINTLATLSNSTSGSVRVRRQADDTKKLIETVKESAILQIQYAYDTIQTHTNTMFANLATAWCELQNRDITVIDLMNNINPSATMSSITRQTISAKKLGDLISISPCINLKTEDIKLITSLRVTEGDMANKHMCYSRPVVSFKIGDSKDSIRGQLVEDNEIIASTNIMEKCEQNSKKYFLFGPNYIEYIDYIFTKTIPANEIYEINTFIDLNITMLPEVDFKAVRIYTNEEIRDSNVVSTIELLRQTNAGRNALNILEAASYKDATIYFMEGVERLFGGLGPVMQGVGKVIGAVAGTLGSLVKGITDFFTNPFGGFTIILIIVVGLVLAFVAFRFVQMYKKNPMKSMFPMTVDEIVKTNPNDPEADNKGLTEEERVQAKQLIRLIVLYSAEEREWKKDLKQNRTSKILNNLNIRKRINGNNGYNKLPSYEESIDVEMSKFE